MTEWIRFAIGVVLAALVLAMDSMWWYRRGARAGFAEGYERCKRVRDDECAQCTQRRMEIRDKRRAL